MFGVFSAGVPAVVVCPSALEGMLTLGLLPPTLVPRYVPCDVSTVCFGMAASMGAFLLGAGAKGKRRALPNSRIMIHQPLGGAQGQAADIEIQAKEILFVRSCLNTFIADYTGQPIEKVQAVSTVAQGTVVSEASPFARRWPLADTPPFCICPLCTYPFCLCHVSAGLRPRLLHVARGGGDVRHHRRSNPDQDQPHGQAPHAQPRRRRLLPLGAGRTLGTSLGFRCHETTRSAKFSKES